MGVAADRTAFGPMFIVAVDQLEPAPRIRDPWVRRILPRTAGPVLALTRFAAVRQLMIAATEKKLRGGWASMLCRKRYIDDQLARAVDNGIESVVVLGAGLETRPYRVPGLAGVDIYELDLPINIKRKARALRRCFGGVPGNVTLLPVDFETADLRGALAQAGYDTGARTFLIWEAVTMYLSEAGVRRTLDQLTDVPPGSELVMTFIRRDFLDGTSMFGADGAYRDFVVKRRLWRFGLDPESVAGFLAEYGWRENEQLGPVEYRSRYLQSSADSEVSEIERCVWASR